MKKYLGIYREFFSSALAEAMSFRVHFVLVIIMDLLFYASSLLSVAVIYEHVSLVGPWNREEFLFFISFMLAVDHIHMALISENFWNFSFLIRSGKLDFELLRPANALFTLFFRHIRIQTLLITPVPWGALYYFGSQLSLSFYQWLAIPFFVVLALALLVSIEILISMSMFYTIESFGINFLRMQLQQLSRWPDFVYKYLARITFTFLLPVLVVGSAPVKFIFNYERWEQLSLMVGAIIVFSILIGIAWTRALKSYESASS